MDSGPAYSERLWAPWPWWVGGTALIASLAWAYGYATQAWVGWLVFAVAEALFVWWLSRSAVRVEVRADGLHAAGAHLSPDYLGSVTALDAEAAARVRGVDADSRAFLVLRGWIATAVQVDVDDVHDPVPYWYVSTRRPRELAQCLDALRSGHDHTADSD